MIKPGYVTSLDPFLVYLVGEDENEDGLPCERRAAAEIGMRGGVDSSTGSRVWVGEYDGDGIPFALRESLSQVNERIEGLVGVGNSNATEIDDVAEIVAVAQQAAADAVAEADAAMQKALDAIDAANQGVGDAAAAQARADKAVQDAADAQVVADKAEADAAQAYLDALEWAKSRGTDLVTNGTGFMGDNTNFSWATFDSSDAPEGTSGSFVSERSGPTGLLSGEIVSMSPHKAYIMSGSIRQQIPGVTSTPSIGLYPHDGHGQAISPDHYMFRPGTTTTLAEPLNPGDTTITLTDASYWSNAPQSHFRSIIWWDYVDPSGKLWPPETYSRNTDNNLGAGTYPVDGISGNVMTLVKPYSGPPRPVGTPLSNGGQGATYMYVVAQYVAATPEWKRYSSPPITGIHQQPSTPGANPTAAGLQLPPGAAGAKVLILSGYNIAGGPVTREAFAGISISDASAALARADQANNLAATAKANAQIADDKAAAANTLAGEANTAAGFAQAAAVGAQSTADSAESAAGAAASAAATAQQKANQAATDLTTLAGKTGETIRQTSAPTGSRANARNLWIRLPDGKLHGYDGTNWVPITDPALVQAAADVITAQQRADKGVEDAALAKTAADQAAAAASLAQSAADTADAKASTADGRYTVATRDPMMSDGEGKPIDAVWEVRSGFTAARRFVWVGGPPSWVQVKIGPDFVGDKAIGRAQIGDAAIGTLQVGDAQITNAKIGSLSVGKLDVLNGTFKTAVIDTLVGQSAFLDALHVRGAITIGGPNKVNNILMADGAVTSRVMKADEVFVGLKLASPVIETSTHATTGIKIVGDRLVGYGPGNQKQVDIGGPDGIIKGVTIEGALMTGGVFQTDEEGPDRVVIGVDQQRGPVIALRSSYFDKPLLLMAYDNIEGAASVEMFNPNYDFPYATWDQFGLSFTHASPTWGDLGGIGPSGNLVQVSGRHGLLLDSTQGDVTVNGVDVAGREVVTLSSVMKMVRQGRTRELYFDQSGTWSSGSVVAFGTVPAADRPTLGDARGTVYLSGNGFNPGAVTITVSGTVNVINPNSVAQTRARGHVVWTV